MDLAPRLASVLGFSLFVSLSVHACIFDDRPFRGVEGDAISGAGVAGEGGAAPGWAGEQAGGRAGASGGIAGSEGGAPLTGAGGHAGDGSGGAGGLIAPPHPCDTPVCQPGDVGMESAPCGDCDDKITRTRTCRADTCTWGGWSAWSACAAECKPDHWRCCGSGKWEWCFKNTCRWTGDCAACSSGSCNCP